MSAPLHIDNVTARRLWLERHALLDAPPTGTPLARAERTVEQLGMVQLDPIRTVARAHDHILWTRAATCRPPVFERLITERQVFEHFSHDACILPMSYWPVWRRQFARRAASYERTVFGRSLPATSAIDAILARIETEGPLSSRDFQGRADRRLHAWMKPAHKLALDWLWLSGRLAVADRRGFAKRYELVERVVPEAVRAVRLDDEACIDRLHRDALERMGVANAGELKRFWDACSTEETRRWIDGHRGALIEVDVQGHDGSVQRAWTWPDIEARLAALPDPGRRVRILNPFDPAVRDRRRVERLFGFRYTIEIYVPAAKRRYGYYVYPVLEGDRLIGRCEVVRERAPERLRLQAFWPEPDVRLGKERRLRIVAELQRFARLAGVTDVDARALLVS